jgi:hypothetical protein
MSPMSLFLNLAPSRTIVVTFLLQSFCKEKIFIKLLVGKFFVIIPPEFTESHQSSHKELPKALVPILTDFRKLLEML